jgi:exonuclease III
VAAHGKARDHEHLIVGDFNIAPEDRDAQDLATWIGSVRIVAPERGRLPRPPVMESWIRCGYSLAARCTVSHIDP